VHPTRTQQRPDERLRASWIGYWGSGIAPLHTSLDGDDECAVLVTAADYCCRWHCHCCRWPVAPPALMALVCNQNPLPAAN